MAAVLLAVLNHVLAAHGLLLVRDGSQFAHHLVAYPDKVFTYDEEERGIPRKADRDGQAKEYNAKRAHRLKNNTSRDNTQYLHYGAIAPNA